MSAAQTSPDGGGRGRGGGGRGAGGGRGGFGRGGSGAKTIAARLHIGADGIITVMTGKVECGQGSRAELTQAAAEELCVSPDQVRLIMADTGLVPNDGGTAGSGTTPSTVPSIRRGCAAARDLLLAFAANQWAVDAKTIEVRAGKAVDAGSQRTLTYTDLATDKEAAKGLEAAIPADVALTPVEKWKVLGTPVARPNGRDLVTGTHQYTLPERRSRRSPTRPNGSRQPILAVPGCTIISIRTLAAARRSTHLPRFVSRAAKSLRQTYHVAYVQHCPMEPRAAVAELVDGKLTVWTGTQMPFGVRSELARELGIGDDRVRVIVPDFGGGFGGKHSGECAVEAARLARAAGKPVHLRWTREEEFTWAYFRPAGVIEAEASLDEKGTLTSWNFVNINSGGNEVQSPYRVAKSQGRFVQSDPPLRHGSYRALAVTANTFGRESFMDEMANAAGMGPLKFRLAHLDAGRLRDVLEEAAKQFDWIGRSKKMEKNVGVAIVMGLGPALREEMQFEGGKILNAALSRYLVPRFADMPEIDVHLIDRPDVPSAGAGETPIIAIAPAVANAVFAATGVRVREMPIRMPGTRR